MEKKNNSLKKRNLFTQNSKPKNDYPLVLLRDYLAKKLETELLGIKVKNIKLGENFIQDVSGTVHTYLINNFYLQCIEYEYQITKRSEPRTPANKNVSKFANTILNDRKSIKLFFKNYPVLISKTKLFYKYIISFIKEIVLNVEKDYDELCISLNLKENILVDIKLFKGDLHNLNKSTSFLIFDKDQKIVYKPHSVSTDIFFYNLVEEFCPFRADKVAMIAKDNYGYAEYIVGKHNFTSGEAKEYFQNFGFISYIFYLLGTGDLIHDNVLPGKINPIFIDLESIVINNKLKTLKKIDSIEENDDFIRTSLLTSYVIPYKFNIDDNFDLCSPLLKFRSANIQPINDEHSNLPHYVFNLHLPRSADKAIDINDGFVEDFNIGFEKAFRAIDLIEFCERIPNHLVYRVLLRDTFNYSELIRESNKPFYLKSEKVQKDLFKNLFLLRRNNRKLAKLEIKRLSEHDVPYFFSSIIENKVFSIDSEYLGYFVSSSRLSAKNIVLSKVKQTLNLGNDFVENHKRITTFSLDAAKPTYEIFEKLILKKNKYKRLIQINLDNFIIDVFNALERTFLNWKENIFLIGLGTSRDRKNFTVQTLNNGLYHGVNGVALFFLYAVKKTNNSHIKDIFEKIYRYNFSLALRELEINEFKELSLFEGPSSFIYLHLTMHKVFHMPLNNYLMGKFENWLLICFEKDKNLDFLTGISGIVGFVISNKSYFSDHFISNIIERYIHKVEETMNYDSQTETVYWNHIKEFDGQAGLSHGVGGYLFTLSGIFSYKKDEKILKMIIASYNYIKSMNLNSKDGFAYFDRKKDSLVTSGWTHGASGTIYSLLKAYSCVQKNYLPGIEQTIVDTYRYILKESFTKNYSLATGVCGNLFALKYGYQFVEQLDSSLAKSAIIKIEKMTLGDVFNSTDFTKTFLHSSLFTGISGVPLTLLYLFDDNCEIFNFLNLE